MGQGKGCTGGLGCTLIFFLFFFTIEGEGGGGECFFLPSFDMWKEEGKGMIFFFNFVFSLWSG